MNRATAFLRRALGVILAITPLLAGADLCTVGALTGRADLACAMESGGPACRTVVAATPKCSRCAPAAPVPETPRSQGPTCCDLRPQGTAVAGQPVLDASSSAAVAVVSPLLPVSDPAASSSVRPDPDDGRAPPGGPPDRISPRAPPLS